MGELKNICRTLGKEIEIALKAKPEKNESVSGLNDTYLKSKGAVLLNSIKKSPTQLSRIIWKEFDIDVSDDKRKKFNDAQKLVADYEKAIKNDELRIAAAILDELSEIVVEKKGVKFINKIPFPEEIKDFMDADISELEKTFNSGCFRSSIIICGRLLETALHRKFYEKTGTDILEKHPEIGLGKIIAKLEELNIPMPPGLTQQIHLINQARIHSVHKKKEAFLPSREQAYAVILFTIDVLKKLF